MKLKKLFKNKLAFTLVELIVVIAILAILASVATVSTIAILNNTRKTPVENAVDAVKNTITIYIASGGKFTWKDLAPELAKMENCSVPSPTTAGAATAVSGDAVSVFCTKFTNATSSASASAVIEIRNQYFKVQFTVNSEGVVSNQSEIKKVDENF